MATDARELKRARKLLREAVRQLRFEANAMTEEEIRSQPYVRQHLRLANRIEKFLEGAMTTTQTRMPRQMARQFLDEAVRQGIIANYVLRNAAGGGTVYWGGGKSFPKSVLDVISLLKQLGFRVEEK